MVNVCLLKNVLLKKQNYIKKNIELICKYLICNIKFEIYLRSTKCQYYNNNID